MTISPLEKRRYPLVGSDAEILHRIHEVERLEHLSSDEVFFLLFLRTQLEKDWRGACLQLLDQWISAKNLSQKERWNAVRSVHKQWWNPRKLRS